MTSLVTEADAIRLLHHLDEHGVRRRVDGGWGVDALLGEQTREHRDLDLVVEACHEALTREILREHGFRVVPMWFSTPVHTVWRDDGDQVVDLHVITRTFCSAGNSLDRNQNSPRSQHK